MSTRPALWFLICACACGQPPAPHDRAAVARVAASATPAPGVRPPVATKHAHETEEHGHKLTDDYFWLRNKGSPEVVSYLDAESTYADAMMHPLESFRRALYDEEVARMVEDDASVPAKDGRWLYYWRYEKGQQYPIHCRKLAGPSDAPEVVILDENELAKGNKYTDVGIVEWSNDGNVLAYTIDTTGSRDYVLRTIDLRSRAAGPEAVPNVDSVAWADDNKTLFYVTHDPQTKRSNRLWRHVLGDGIAKDVLLHDEVDEKFSLFLWPTLDHAYVTATSMSPNTSEVRLLDARKPTRPAVLVAPREQDHRYFVDHRGALFYIRTNSDGAKNFRIVTAPDNDPKRANWKELLPVRADHLLYGMVVHSDVIVLLDEHQGVRDVELWSFKSGSLRNLAESEPVYDVLPCANLEFTMDRLRLTYQSLVTPRSVIDVDPTTGARTVLKQDHIGSYDPSAYESKRVAIPARDGTPIPVSLVYRKGTNPDGTHPMYLEGYGAYGFPYALRFVDSRVTYLDRGFVCAIAHVRGGGELGKQWHDAGRLMSKMNTFTDFIDVAEGLKKQGWAKHDALVADGRSAGGLLMGAVANMRPDIFRVIVGRVPWVDVVNDMLDPSLPLTTEEYEEWGDPRQKEAFEYMLQYSPYENVHAQRYPAMLARASYNDTQVLYWGVAKWVAKLRATKTDDNTLLLKVNMDPAGHRGASGRYDKVREQAFDDAFVLSQLGFTH